MTNPADIPPPLPWGERSTDVATMPGGNPSYFETLREICGHIEFQHPSPESFVSWLQDHYGLGREIALRRSRFLLRADILDDQIGTLHLGNYASRWYATGDDGILIALLHSRLKFIGEMLTELLTTPRTSEELRSAASTYGLDWAGRDQVGRRRRWLESANLIASVSNGRIAITDEGRDLLNMLEVHQPELGNDRSNTQVAPKPASQTPPASLPESQPPTAPTKADDPTEDRDPTPAEVLADEIRDASTDSKNPDRLEIAVRDAFQFLGFDAEKLGGSGKTDVLVKAPLGRDDSYSVAIDAKTVGSGSLGYGQVDYLVLDSHRKQHKADYSMLVGPNPSGKQLMDLAVAQSVAVLSTEQLADLCLQHANAPLGLQDYRVLFDTGGVVDMAPISRAAQDLIRLRELAAELLATLVDQTSETGPLTARDLWLLLRNHPSAKTSLQQGIQQVLDTLASPPMGAVKGTTSEGYVLATAPHVTQQRLHQLGDQLTTRESAQ